MLYRVIGGLVLGLDGTIEAESKEEARQKANEILSKHTNPEKLGVLKLIFSEIADVIET